MRIEFLMGSKSNESSLTECRTLKLTGSLLICGRFLFPEGVQSRLCHSVRANHGQIMEQAFPFQRFHLCHPFERIIPPEGHYDHTYFKIPIIALITLQMSNEFFSPISLLTQVTPGPFVAA